MKFKKLAIIVLAIIMVLTFTGCGEAKFMSTKEVNQLTTKYGKTPQMQMTVEYQRGDDFVQLELTYNLLLEKAPITVVNFINLVNDGYYNPVTADGNVKHMIFDSRISSSTNAWIAGRYTITEEEGKINTGKGTYEVATELDYTIKGESVQNGWVLPAEEGSDATDGNAKLDMFSLAMYHVNTEDNFDNASAAFFLTVDSDQKENYKNYAVFAHLASVKVIVNDTVLQAGSNKVPASIYDDFASMAGTTSRKVKLDADGNTETRSMFATTIRIAEVKMLGTADYSTLPRDYVIQK